MMQLLKMIRLQSPYTLKLKSERSKKQELKIEIAVSEKI